MDKYQKQVKDFLSKTNSTLEIVQAEDQKPLWAKKGEKYGLHYKVTLKNKNHSYTFDFWDSVYNRETVEAIKDIAINHFMEDQAHYRAERLLQERGINWHLVRRKDGKTAEIEKYKPTEYDILACLNPLY